MEFNNQFPEWKNEGTSPPEELKTNGFEGGDKPPAAWLNWLCNLVGKCISELQSKLHTHSIDNTNPHQVTASQVGLDKVNNTSDAEKSVKFASEAASSRKVQYPFTIRFKGGSTEGTDLWTYDGSTSRSVNITPDKIGAANKSEIIKIVNAERTLNESTEIYVATDEDITSLVHGMELTIIPSENNTTLQPRLDINGLGDKAIRIGHSFNYAATNALKVNYFQAGRPVKLKYDANCSLGIQGEGAWILTDKQKTSAQDLYGKVPIESGGTGASTVEEALENLMTSYVTVVSYVGTGTNSASNPCSLTFDFAPKIIKVLGYGHTVNGKLYQNGVNNYVLDVILCDLFTTEFDENKVISVLASNGSHNIQCKKSEDGKTISWYGGSDSAGCNESGYTYYFMAIG